MVLHGLWRTDGPTGGLRLWAEDAQLPRQVPRRAGRRARVVDHPFAAPAEALARALGLPPPGTGSPASAELALPSLGRDPLPSPQLDVAEPDAGRQDVSAPTWRVPVIDVDADHALALLRRDVSVAEGEGADGSTDAGVEGGTDAGAEDGAAAGVEQPAFGTDLAPYRALAAFAGDLAARGRVVPTVVAGAYGSGSGSARWRAVVTGEDADWLRALAAACPQAPPSTLAAACDALVDAAVRAAIAPPGRRRGRPTWRSALRGADRAFPASPVDVTALRSVLATWQRDAVGTRALRAVFRLVDPEPPAGPEVSTAETPAEPGTPEPGTPEPGTPEPATSQPTTPWRLDLAIQPADSPSLIIDAAAVWGRRRPRALAGYPGDPAEALLAELGRAVRLYPALEGALRTATPTHLELSTAAAHDFLTETAPVLLGAGFGVVLPHWWTSPAARLGARVHASTPAQPGQVSRAASIGMEGLVEFSWQLALGDEQLTDEEVERLVAGDEPLVHLRGQWVQVDADRLRRARAFLARRATGPRRMSLVDVLRAGAGVDDGPGGLPVVGLEADGWLDDLLAGAEHRLQPVTAPDGFTGVLRPYQERGLAWLAFHEAVGTGAVLADDMGLGKTVQLLALMCRDGDPSGENTGDPTGHPSDLPSDPAAPTLLVCPTSLVGTWQREAARFTPALRVHVHHGAQRPRGEEFTAAVTASDLVVTTYALLARDAADLRAVPWRRIVLDEAQAIKNAATKAAAAARSIPAPRRIAVTGTPVENRLADLWSLMHFANPDLLGSAAQFKDTFATPVERHGDPDAAARLRALTQPFVLRRTKTDPTIITDLPAKLEMEVVCPLTPEQARLYSSVVADMLERLESAGGMERKGLVLATMTKLKQVCNHPAQFLGDGSRLAGRSGKLDRLEGILEEVLAAGERALLFTQYAEFGRMLRTHLASRTGREVAFLHGGVPRTERDAMVARFQDGSGPPLFVLSLKAGGTGLTLTAANHVVHVDRWWNPAVEDQATDRAYRIGQTKQVQVRKLVCAGTLEEKIAAMIRDKRELAASVVGTGEAWLTELSTAQLRELIALEPEAVAA